MRAFQAALLAAILVVLSVIALDLHRIARWWVPTGPAPTAAHADLLTPAQTRQQRREEFKREVDEATDDLEYILKNPKRAPRATQQPSDQRPH